MTEPVLTLLLISAFLIASWAVHFFRTLGGDFWETALNPMIAGVAAGVLIRLAGVEHLAQALAAGVLLTLSALYSRLTGDESEPTDGMLLGAVSGAAASIPLVMNGDEPMRSFAQCVLAGAAAGFGITWGALHVADKMRQVIWDIGTAGAAVAAAWTPATLARFGVDDRRIAIGAGAILPLLVVAAVFRQWPDVRAELRHEASLGFIDDPDVRTTAHPIRRLGRGGWTDAGAHRQFVRIANRIALRKRQQRYRSEDMARLHQLEVMKLRMQLQKMSRIEHASSSPHGHDDEHPSDTMPASE